MAGPTAITTGEMAGWMTWETDPFELVNGPFYFREEEESGEVVCRMKAERRHLNGGGAVHGGCLMTFADFCLFALAWRALGGGPAVTVTFASEFAGAALEGDVIETRGEVVRAGGSLIFVRGKMTTERGAVLNFSGVLKKVRK